MRKEKNLVRKIGIFGGTFDPPHKGHIQIANFSIKKLKLDHLIWAITSKNPLKKKPFLPIKTRVLLSKKITAKNKKIKIRNYDNFLKSGKTIKLIKFLKDKNSRSKLYFIMGSDNLIKFHKWNDWKKIPDLCNIVVFPRSGYFKKTLTSKAYKILKKTKIIFLKSRIANISSSKIRKNYLI